MSRRKYGQAKIDGTKRAALWIKGGKAGELRVDDAVPELHVDMLVLGIGVFDEAVELQLAQPVHNAL